MAKDFTLDDFRQKLDQLQKMGMKDLLGRLPGTSEMVSGDEDSDVALNRIRLIIDAMTDEERRNPDIIDSSRRSRIATSSGTQPKDVEKFLVQFDQARALMRKMVTGFGKFPG